jgi:hypothetical protein
MHTLELGLPVTDVRGRSLGAIVGLLGCCFRVSGAAEPVQRDAVLSISQFGVELICSNDQLPLYACPEHGHQDQAAV